MLEPVRDLSIATGQRDIEQRGLSRDCLSHPVVLGEDNNGADRSRLPALLFREQPGHNTCLLAQCREEILHVDNLGLDFDDEHGLRCALSGDDVHRPAITEVVERPLELDLPALIAQNASGQADEPSVTLIEKALHVPALVRAKLGFETEVEASRNAFDQLKLDAAPSPKLDLADDMSLHSGARRYLSLGEVALQPDGADLTAKTKGLHGADPDGAISSRTYPGLITHFAASGRKGQGGQAEGAGGTRAWRAGKGPGRDPDGGGEKGKTGDTRPLASPV